MKRQKTQSRGLQRNVHVSDVQCSQDECTHGQKCLKMIKNLIRTCAKINATASEDKQVRRKKQQGMTLHMNGCLSVWSIHQKCFSKCKVTRKLVIWRRRDQILMIQNSRRLRNRTCYQRDEIEYFVRNVFLFIEGRRLEDYFLLKSLTKSGKKNTFSKMTFSDQKNSKNKRRVKRRT